MTNKRQFKNLILTQATENRKTSHLYSNCTLTMRTPTMEECNLTKSVIYQAYGYDRDHLKMIEIQYEDGCTFGEILVGFITIGTGIMLEHISPVEDHRWKMVLTKQVAPTVLLINERKVYGRMYTSFVDGSLKQGFKEQIYDGNSDYDLPAEFGGDYTAKCKACNSIFQTQFVKIYRCPICGYSKNGNIE